MSLRYSGINISTYMCFPIRFRLQHMKGHVTSCGCVACKTIARINQLLVENSGNPAFIQFAGDRLRIAESELRDELSRYPAPAGVGFAQGSVTPKRPPGVAATGSPAKAQGAWPVLSGPLPPGVPQLGVPAPPPPGAPKDPLPPPPPPPGLSAKVPSASPPHAKEKPVKTEPSPDQEAKEPIQDLKSQEPTSPSKGSAADEQASKKKKRKRSSSPGIRKENRKQKRHTPDRSPRARRQEESVEEEDSYRRDSGGREKKRRNEGEPEGAASSGSRRPREPSHPPPSSRGKSQGKGWRGELPVSSHPRWYHRKDKGLVKVAKQELWHRRRSSR